MTSVLKEAWTLFRCAVVHWASDQAATIGAALAFYCAFSLAPLLLILVTVTGWILGTEVAQGQLADQLTSLFGLSTAKILLNAMKSSQTDGGLWATVIGVVTLFLGATTVFAALEAALENIWRATTMVPRGIWGWLRTRLLSFGFILAVGFLLLVSLSLSTAIAALRKTILVRHEGLVAVAAIIDFVLSVGLVTALIALIYRYLPARRLEWNPVLRGALITALLFQAGRWAIGLYLGRSAQPSAFGAAASFVAMLLWLYYTAQIFLLGAEFTACLGGIRKEQSNLEASTQTDGRTAQVPALSRRKQAIQEK